MTIPLHKFGGQTDMSDQRRERQLERAAAALASEAPPLPPEIRRIVDLKADARQCIFYIDLLREQLLPGMVNQLGLVGGIRFIGQFVNFIKALEMFRAQVLLNEGSGIVIAQSGDVPPARG